MVIGSMDKTWKAVERKVARLLGGRRTGNTGMPSPDVLHPLFSVEVKYRQRLPSLLSAGMAQAKRAAKGKIPLLILKQKGQRGEYAVLEFQDLLTLLSSVGLSQQEGPHELSIRSDKTTEQLEEMG